MTALIPGSIYESLRDEHIEKWLNSSSSQTLEIGCDSWYNLEDHGSENFNICLLKSGDTVCLLSVFNGNIQASIPINNVTLAEITKHVVPVISGWPAGTTNDYEGLSW